MYSLPPEQGAQVLDLRQMGGLPFAIALGVAAAAVLALALTIFASVRQRRRELALLKSLGMRRGQLRAVVLSQTTTILVVAIAIGIPLGVAAGPVGMGGLRLARSASYQLPSRPRLPLPSVSSRS